MTDPGSESIARFAAAYGEFENALDWPALERLYVDGPSEGFFSAEQIAAQRDTALLFAADFADELQPGGTSLYVGVGLAELPLLLFESIVLERGVQAVTLPGAEARELERARLVVEQRLELELPKIDTRSLADLERVECDHLWFVSVVSDPTAFPALHRKLYGLAAPKAKPLVADTARAQELISDALLRLAERSLVHTTDEEFELLAEQAARRGRELAPGPSARYSGIVGDPVRPCRLVKAGPGAGLSRGAGFVEEDELPPPRGGRRGGSAHGKRRS